MKQTWQSEPTAAAQVVRRAMVERGWKQQDIAQHTGLDAPNVSRWARGAVNPPDHRVAEIAAALGYDPRDFGITSPHALAKASHRSSAVDAAPEWAVRHHEEVLLAISRLADTIAAR